MKNHLRLCRAALIFLCGVKSQLLYAEQSEVPDINSSNTNQSISKQEHLDAKDVELFSDSSINLSLGTLKIPGVSLAIVYQGKPLLIKGYGLADIENRFLVDPHRSEFAVASISKTFTYTALMQLVERGKISFDDSVEDILELDFSTKEPIQVKHLFTHSAGFEDGYLGQSAADDQESNILLMDYIHKYKPEILNLPGEQIVYSNYSTILAGAIIQKVTGKAFPQYMKEHLLEPLGMHHSSFYDEPIPSSGARHRAVGYQRPSSNNQGGRKHFHHFGLLPAAGLKATASDMAKFMSYHLDANKHTAISNLVDTKAGGWKQKFEGDAMKRNHPQIGGNAFGFWVNDYRGLTSISHSGNTKGFKSDMHLFPELSLGIFISANSTNGHKLTSRFAKQFVEQFYANKLNSPKILTNSDFDLSKYSGLYLSKRRNESTIEKLAARALYIGSNQNSLTVYIGGTVVTLLPLGEDVFLDKESGKKIVFTEDKNGQINILRDNDVMEKIKGWQDAGNLLKVINLLAVLSALVVGLRFLRRYYQVEQQRTHILTGRILAFIAANWLVFYFCLSNTIASFSQGVYPEIFIRFPDTWTMVGQFALLLIMLSIVAIFYYLPKMLVSNAPLGSKIGYMSYAGFTVLVLIWSNYFNMIGFKF